MNALIERSLRALTISFLFIISVSVTAFSQAPVALPTPSCPTVLVSSPDSVKSGQSLTMTANVSGGDPNVTPTYNWSVSAGFIESGQGTSTITIDTKKLDGATSVTGSAEVGGYDRSCSTYSSNTTMITKSSEALKFDEFGRPIKADQSSRLDNLAIEIEKEPTAQGYIIAYGGRKSAKGEAQKMNTSARNYLIKARKINAAQIVTVDGGYREEPTMELWIVPADAIPPSPSPTVDPSELKIVKTKSVKIKTKSVTKSKRKKS